MCVRVPHGTETTCLDPLYDFPLNGLSGWSCPKRKNPKTISGLLPLFLCYSCSQHSCVDLNSSLVSSSGTSTVCCLSTFPRSFLSASPLQITAVRMFLDVERRHHMNAGEGGGSRWQTQEGESVVVPSPRSRPGMSQREAFGAIFVSGRQLETSERGSVGKLTTAPAQRPQTAAIQRAPCVHADPSHPLSPRASAYMHNFTTSPGRAVPAASHAVVTGEYSVSHTLCIMFASFHRTNTATARAPICSPARIFNYFSHP